MKYSELLAEVIKQLDSDILTVDMNWIDSSLIPYLDTFFEITDKGIIYIANAEIVTSDDKLHFKIHALIPVGRLFRKASFRLNILIQKRNKTDEVDYLLSVEPNGHWTNHVEGKNVLDMVNSLDLPFADCVFYYSNFDYPVHITINEDEDFEVIPHKGENVSLIYKNDFLKAIKLSDFLFEVVKEGEDFILSKIVDLNVIPFDFIRLGIERIKIADTYSISVAGKISLPLFSNKPYSGTIQMKDGDIVFDAEIFVAGKFSIPYGPLGTPIEVYDVTGLYSGNLSSGSFNYGVRGSLKSSAAKKDSAITLDTPLGSDEFEIIYNNNNSTPIPSFFQCRKSSFTANEAIKYATGIGSSLPASLNNVLTLSDVYIYYCDYPGVIVRGKEADLGCKLFGKLTFFKVNGLFYFAAVKQADGTSKTGNCQIILEPINVLNVIQLGGDSTGRIEDFPDTKLKPNGLEFNFKNEKEETVVKSSIKVSFLNQTIYNVPARLSSGSLKFNFHISGGDWGKMLFHCEVNSESFTMDSNIMFKVPIKFTLKPFKIDTTVGIDCSISIAGSDKPTVSVSATLTIIGQRINIPFKIDFNTDIFENGQLEKQIIKKIEDELKKLLEKPLYWLKAIADKVFVLLEGALDYKIIADELNRLIALSGSSLGVEKIASMLKQVGIDTRFAHDLLVHGYKQEVGKTIKLLKDAGYNIEVIVKDLLNGGTDKMVQDVYNLLKNIAIDDKEIGRLLSDCKKQVIDFVSKLPEDKNVAKLLKGLGYGPEQAMEILKDQFGIKDVKKIVKFMETGFSSKELSTIADSVFKAARKSFGKRIKVRIRIVF